MPFGGGVAWFLIVSPGDYFVHQQNVAPAHNAGSTHQKWMEAPNPKRVLFRCARCGCLEDE